MTRHAHNFFNVLDYGAVGNGQTLNTTAIQSTIEACSQSGGGTVYIPAGVYLTGSIFLKSNLTLHLDAGATLLGSKHLADFPIIDNRWEGINQKTYAPLIGGDHLNNIAITGRGTIDGSGAHWWEKHRAKTLAHPRPRLISFCHCTNILIEGITATNSPSWTINPIYCENVTIDKVTILNPPDSPNTDGINPDSCRNVHIANCHLDVGDDCITIKSGTEDGGRDKLSPCENITITNCTMVHGHGGVVIGSEMSGGVRNVVISNCVFTGTDRGIRLKSRRGRGGLVEDIRVTNVVMKDVLCPFIMNLYYGCGAWGAKRIADKNPYPVTEGTPRFRRIYFSNITAREIKYAAGFIYGLAEMPVEDVSFSDISVSMALEAEAGVPAMAPNLEPMQRAGFFTCNVQGLRFHNVEVTYQNGAALSLVDGADVDVNACTMRTPCVDAPLIYMRNVERAYIHGCQATPGTGTFLQLEGQNTRAIILGSNNLTQARQPIDLANNVPANTVLWKNDQ
jgi:polygalacturonase